MRSKNPTCDLHPKADAVYRCGNCHKALCSLCVKQDKFLTFCSICEGGAFSIAKAPVPLSLNETVSEITREFKGLALPFISQIILPAVIILMVGAFLFFLLDVRSVFFSDSVSIRRVAFCFGAATVLIARFGRIYGFKERQIFYTLSLAVVTSLVMLRYSHGALDYLVIILIIAAVWWLSTRITNCLDLGEEEKKEQQHVYGVEREHREKVLRKFNLNRNRSSTSKDLKYAYGNPSSAVARLAVIALIAFALGEPVLLSGPPEVGQRALSAVIVFLLATGVVMAAGSAVGVYRRTLKSGGRPSLNILPARMAIGLVLLVLVLTVSMIIPGLKYHGSGELIPQITANDSSEQYKGGKSEQNKGGNSQGDQGSDSGQSGSVFDFIASLGKWLIIPLILLSVGVSVLALVKLWPHLKERRLGIRDLFQNLWDRLKSLSLLRRKKVKTKVPSQKNLMKSLETIKDLSPRETILSAYDFLQAFFKLLGHSRPADNTPHEILKSLPNRYDFLTGPSAALTELYINTVYSQKLVTNSESKEALDMIYKVKNLIENYQKNR